jgi:Mce-associated membrane protein
VSATDALRQAEQAEAEAAEAEAMAAEARARAQDLRQRRATVEASEIPVSAADSSATDSSDVADESAPAGRRRLSLRPTRWLSGAAWRAVAVSAAILVVLALVAVSGYFVWQDRQISQLHEQESQFAAAAQQGVVNLMSLNFNNAQADIQRVIDGTTGEFHDDFAGSTEDFMTVMKESKVITTATVNATAVETMTADSAVVLVAATSQVANSVSKQPNPRIWRLSVTVNKVDDQIKMSKVEFVP